MDKELDAFLTFLDNSQLAVDIFRTISHQIANQHTLPIVDMPHFRISGFDVVLNSLLDASLLTSVTASGLSLWVKQWLREYLFDSEPALGPRTRALVRLYRHHGLRTWKVAAIVASISILLQLSVLLFSVGVVMLAYKLDVALARVLLALNVLWWAATWATALAPTFFPSSPYKSPFARMIFALAYYVRRIGGSLSRLLGACRRDRTSPGSRTSGRAGTLPFRTLEERELDVISNDSDSNSDRRSRLELEALTFANVVFRGSERLAAINACFREVEGKEEALDCIARILREQYGVDEEDSYDQWTHVADALCKHYKDHEKAIHEELDGFLSFSGIFSAVVTLFVGQSVTWLQPDNSQVSVDILRTISKQIANQTTTPIADSDVQPSNTPSRSFTVTDMLSNGFANTFLTSRLPLTIALSFNYTGTVPYKGGKSTKSAL
ncbi:hypothetical protein GSI_05726 [Ganoderma sinense ZZ0214-1]|uniref:DUF6535 domain-containing protein n=1 Tax=Ganoderma sinense ZZ0214-1 TaxID=1077348 RepID=A0A2G8SBC4_9APHY|nr:hypothetical protein GSI_05726 [Ganoderma sinense ZZ0214-1]